MKRFFLNHWLAILIIVVGTFLRVYELNNLGILFGDSARDIIVAIDAVDNNELPLLGIPSSRPQFKQGPLSIWMIMILETAFGNNIYAFSIFFSLLGIGAMIAVYEFNLVFLDKKTGQIALILLSFSPLAIANSRMIYHVTPIPLLTVLSMVFLIRFWRQKKYGIFLAGLSLSLLFQFELSLAPFFLMIPYILWQSKQKITVNKIFSLGLGTAIGVLPQIIFDLTNNFQQLIKFSGWIIFRFTTFFLPGERSFSLEKTRIFLENYWKYFGRMASVDNFIITSIFFIVIIFSMAIMWKNQKNKQAHKDKLIVYKIIYSMFIFLTLGYFINGSPSEAYFPPYFVFVPIIIGVGFSKLNLKVYNSVLALLIAWAGFNTLQIIKANFFVSSVSTFNYGPSIQEQRTIIKYIINESNDSFKLSTTHSDGKFATYLDGYRLLAREKNSRESDDGAVFYIENLNEKPVIPIGFRQGPIKKQSFFTKSVYNVK
jgi:4-amino-4-deoxy-L-arabinose transferase-like glycosyltransferase